MRDERNAKTSEVELIRQRIYDSWTYHDEKCSNYKKCCYILATATPNTHHKLKLADQLAWAAIVVSGMED
jgi:hypothetical protein